VFFPVLSCDNDLEPFYHDNDLSVTALPKSHACALNARWRGSGLTTTACHEAGQRAPGTYVAMRPPPSVPGIRRPIALRLATLPARLRRNGRWLRVLE
jgi:hypothetical protein